MCLAIEDYTLRESRYSRDALIPYAVNQHDARRSIEFNDRVMTQRVGAIVCPPAFLRASSNIHIVIHKS